jgi:isoleucyl-tRNA synthetase
LVKEIKPNFKTLGPRFGKDMKAIADAINGFEATQISALERDGSLTIEISGKNIILDASDVVIQSKDIEGWSVASEQGVTVALDSTLSESLVLEGIARELVNRVQNLRKDKGFEVTDTIALTIEKHSRLQEAVQANESYVMSEILAQKIQFIDKNADGETLSFDDIETMISIHKPTTI